MLTSALKALVKNPVKKSFYGKRKKKLYYFIGNWKNCQNINWFISFPIKTF